MSHLGIAVEQDLLPWGVVATPALVIDDEVVVSGRVPSADDIKRLLAAR